MRIALIQFNSLLSAQGEFIPGDTVIKMPDIVPDSGDLGKNPELNVKSTDIIIAEKNIRLQRSKLLPDLMIGYTNQSFIGTQTIRGQEKYFSSGKRFNSVQAGLSFSLFSFSQKQRIKAAKTSKRQVESEFSHQQQLVREQYQTLREEYMVQKKTVLSYEGIMLANAEQILTAASQQFENGEINYLEWVLLTNQAIGTQAEYADALTRLVKSYIDLKYLSGTY